MSCDSIWGHMTKWQSHKKNGNNKSLLNTPKKTHLNSKLLNELMCFQQHLHLLLCCMCLHVFLCFMCLHMLLCCLELLYSALVLNIEHGYFVYGIISQNTNEHAWHTSAQIWLLYFVKFSGFYCKIFYSITNIINYGEQRQCFPIVIPYYASN